MWRERTADRCALARRAGRVTIVYGSAIRRNRGDGRVRPARGERRSRRAVDERCRTGDVGPDNLSCAVRAGSRPLLPSRAKTRGLPFERLAFPVSAARCLGHAETRCARNTAYTVCSRFENSQKLLGTSPHLTRIQSAPQKLSHAFSCGRVDVLRAGAPECVTPLLFAPLWSRVGEQEHSTKLPVPVPEPNHRKAQSPHGLPCIRQ